jgi:acetyltransferase-like isoleucine patch superfamily enzyme
MIHPLADVHSDSIGEGTYIWQFCVILKGAQIGSNCNLNCNVFIENDVLIGNNVTIKSGVQLWNGVRIENNVFIGPNVTFTNEIFSRSKRYPEKFLETYIRERASLGANSTIIAGNTIGEMAIIGAGAVITKSIAPYTVWYGNPARHKGYVTPDNVLLDLNLKDSKGVQYYLLNGIPVLK